MPAPGSNLPHVPGRLRLRSRRGAVELLLHGSGSLGAFAAMLAVPVVGVPFFVAVNLDIDSLPGAGTVLAAAFAVAFAFAVSVAARVAAYFVGRAVWAPHSGWTNLPLHWADWRRTRTTSLTAEQASHWYQDGSPVPRLRTVEALVALDAPRLSMIGTLRGNHYPLLRLLHAGVTRRTITTITGEARSGSPACGGMSEDLIVSMFAIVPDLTPADLNRFVDGGALVPDPDGPGPWVPLRTWYAKYGRCASYFIALGFTDEEAKTALAQRIPETDLATMCALAAPSP